jgi:hypothetical protein
LPQPVLVVVGQLAHTNKLKKICKKKFISIHKPPASIRFAPIKHALAVTVEPLKFSPAGGLGIELNKKIDHQL